MPDGAASKRRPLRRPARRAAWLSKQQYEQSPAAWSSFGDIRLDAIGTRGLATLDFTPMNVVATDDEGWKFPDTRHWPQLSGRLVGALKLEDEYFVRSCMTGSRVEPDAVQGLRALLLAEAGEASIREGKPVTLPDPW